MMDKKKILLVFNNREQYAVIDMIESNFNFVFEDSIDIETVFLDDPGTTELPDADLYAVLYDNRVRNMARYIRSLDKVIVLQRTVQKEYLPQIYAIPSSESVLIVNDGEESTTQTMNGLYQMGLNDLDFLPYWPGCDFDYKDVRIAITPGETESVPEYIEEIIDIHNRYVSLDTFVSIISMLKITADSVTRNLIRYTEFIAQPDRGLNEKYVEEHLRNETFKLFLNHDEEAIIVTDTDYNIVLCNTAAREDFGISDCGRERIADVLPESFIALIEQGEVEDRLVSSDGVNYMLSEKCIRIVDQPIGYAIVINDEKNIKDKSYEIDQQLIDKGLTAQYRFDDIVYRSKEMEECVRRAKLIAETDYTLLISGESGTGKELFAQSVHNFSKRRCGPFVAINCAALPEQLLESELFGYEKGTFTGALSKGKIGLFERANHGTVFLDEIGDMSPSLQVNLLRVLQEKSIRRLGSDRMISIDVRVIVATNKDLPTAMAKGEFRKDLYYRISNLTIDVPPLRRRKKDILPLAEFYMKDGAELSREEKRCLCDYDWPGNVRELRNAMDYYNVLGDLPDEILMKGGGTQVSSRERENVESGELKTYLTVLAMIRDRTSGRSGVGRASLIYSLREQGVYMSDNKMRLLLGEMKAKGYITVAGGRSGCMISPKGRKYLRENI